MNGLKKYPLPARWMFIADGVLTTLFALGFLVAPAVLLRLYGIDANPASILLARLLAAALLAVAIGQLAARDLADTPAGRAITLGNLAFDIAGATVTIAGVAAGTANPMGLGIAALFIVFGAWRVYLLAAVYRRLLPG